MKRVALVLILFAFTAFMLAWLLQPARPKPPQGQPITSTFIGFTNSSGPLLAGTLALFRIHNHPWVRTSPGSKSLDHSQVFSIESRIGGAWKPVPTVGRVPLAFQMNNIIDPDVIVMVGVPATNQELRVVMEIPGKATGLRAVVNHLCAALGLRPPASPLFRGHGLFFTNETLSEPSRSR